MYIPFPSGPSSKLLKNTSFHGVYSTSVAVISTLRVERMQLYITTCTYTLHKLTLGMF